GWGKRGEEALGVVVPRGAPSKTRLGGARRLLHARLTRRGVGLSSTFVGALLSASHSPAAVTNALVQGTTRAAVALAGGKATGISTQVTALGEGGLRAMFVTKVKVASGFALATLLIGSVVVTRMFEPAAAQPPRLTEGKETPVRDANEPAKAKDSPERPVDALGDPLPPGALMRLGTRRHRVQTWPLTWHGPADGRSYLVHQRLGTRDEIRRLDADSGRVLETWPVPDKHHAVGLSPDGRQVLMSTAFL